MVLNLAVADILNLFVNAPMYYLIKYHNDEMFSVCKAFAVFRFLIHALIELSVVAISGQRYFATISAFKENSCYFKPRTKVITVITVVWMLSLMLALIPALIVFEFPNGVCYPVMKYENWAETFYILSFTFDGVALPILLFAFSILTARILKKSAREIPSELANSEQELARYRSAKVVTAIAIAYIICFIPRCFLSFIISSQHLDNSTIFMMYLDEITNYLIFSNSCLNPIALYLASRVFRRHFNRYLFPCYRISQNINKRKQSPVSRTTSEFRISGVFEHS
ncbi:hypothetical protein L9F63_015835 [Diploptera punctata]|uniref:G-protein coupled receptors family 1 profile domain-containing protein n=1 Tax=Diploptera punctata TaxID=6984 RepID=A0AAD8A548_DIPPU|nr:hypothetical protein L9F63_015835 [Diploptera punctata]